MSALGIPGNRTVTDAEMVRDLLLSEGVPMFDELTVVEI